MNIIIFTACCYQNNLIRNRLLARGPQYAKIASRLSEVESLIDMPPKGFCLDDSEEYLRLVDNIRKGNHSACPFSAVTMLTIDDTLSQMASPTRDFVYIPNTCIGPERCILPFSRPMDRRIAEHKEEIRYKPCLKKGMVYYQGIDNAYSTRILKELSQYLEQAIDKESIIRRSKTALVQWEFPQSRIDSILNPHTGVR